MKTLSQITKEDILSSTKPKMVVLAISGTSFGTVEQVVMLKPVAETAIPQQAYIIIGNDSRRFMAVDASATTEYTGEKAMVMNLPMHYMPRKVAKYYLSNLLADDMTDERAYRTLIAKLRYYSFCGIADGTTEYPVRIYNEGFKEYVMAIITEIHNETNPMSPFIPNPDDSGFGFDHP